MTMLHVPPLCAHDGQIELISTLLAERAWEYASFNAETPWISERTSAISLSLDVLSRTDLRQGYITAGVLNPDMPVGVQLNQILAFVARTPHMVGAQIARVVWAPLNVAEAFSMIRWLSSLPMKGGA